MNNVSLKEQLQDMSSKKYPFVRHDGRVRANVLASFNDENGEDMVLVAVVDPNPYKRHHNHHFDGRNYRRAYDVAIEATIRCVTAEYFENNFWEGKN
jgi:hypothetical protein